MTVIDIPTTSRAAVIAAYNEPLDVREVPVPEEIEPGALLVRIEVASICGSDVHVWDGSLSESVDIDLPVIPGHEMVGRVAQFGAGADVDTVGEKLAIGDRVIFTHASCGHCHYCTVAHQPTLCNDRQWYMFSCCERPPYLVGGFSQYCYVFPNSGRIRVPDDVKSGWASAASCALRTVVQSYKRLGALESWQTVVIQGAGPLGLFATAMAEHKGAGRIITIGGPDRRLEVARNWGAGEVVSVEENPTSEDRVRRVRALTDGAGADVVMELSGAPTAFAEGLNMLRDGGRYVITGQVGGQVQEIQPARVTRRNWTLLGSWSAGPAEYWEALQFLSTTKDRYDFDALLSGEYGLEEINLAMERMQRYEEIKPVVVP